MKRRVRAVLLVALLLVCLIPVPSDAVGGIAAREAAGNGRPYYIMVNRKMSTVTVYGLDEDNRYTVPVRAMLCSAGSAQHMTPKGNFSIGQKYRWHLMLGGVYAQYLSQFRGSCLFHSVCYARPSPDTLLPGYYDNLGSPASHGCARLQTEDAKWIYENCAEGTFVTVYDGDDPGELGKPEKMVPAPGATNACRWDPTDPEPENPWAESWTTDFTLSEDVIRLLPGETVSLQISRQPAGSTYPTAMYVSDASSVALADGAGRIRAVGAGSCTVTVSCGAVEKRCTVVVAEEPLPAPEEAWYSSDVRYLSERGFLSETSDFFSVPEGALTRGEASALFRGVFRLSILLRNSDSMMTRREFVELLYLNHSLPVLLSSADEALSWADQAGLLLGHEDGSLASEQCITRAQAAAILHRYCVIFGK
ncbi:MAG: L,D-transpeptidase family protein [Oscillospiraceae bacterium]|nr:L,D-transpeptidase family protein [Oscillospiraceae bacterium]